MPTMQNFSTFFIINLAFLIQIIGMVYFRSALDIKENWPLYRCNPPYWFFSDNISEDFTYCVQNSQLNIMGNLLQPITYLISNLISMGSEFSESINNIRFMISNIRGFVGDIMEKVINMFFNIVLEFQKMLIAIKDMVGKMVGINVTILYVLDGAIKTMKSTWNGPPGQIVRSIGSCFHPDTKIKTKDGQIFMMKDLPLGVELEDGCKVFSVLKIDNPKKELLYKFKQKDTDINRDIYVTGEHFIQDHNSKQFIQVKDHPDAVLQTEVYSDWFSCLITTNRRIKIGDYIFWDWEDDDLKETKVTISHAL
jgi:hypothetical protein